MTVDRLVHVIAGLFILTSLALAHFVSPKWLYFTTFVGLNLLQSGFSNWCPLAMMLAKIGVPVAGDPR